MTAGSWDREGAAAEEPWRLWWSAAPEFDLVLLRYRTRPELACEYVSEGVASLTGHPVDAHRADPELLFACVHPADTWLLDQVRTDPAGSPGPKVLRFVGPDGEQRWVRLRHVPMLEHDEVVGFTAIAYDVTADRERVKRIREGQQRFQALVDNLFDLLLVVRSDSTVSYANPACHRILGRSPGSLIGRSAHAIVHPEDRGAFEAVFDTWASGAAAHPIEMRVRHGDGDWRWLEVAGRSLLDDPGVEGIVVNARDITERRELEQQLAHRALHDPLTGLANRALFESRLEQALARLDRHGEQSVAVLFIDLDRFKLINDAHGHEAGDRVLTAVASRLEHQLRQGDTAGRVGGDEFVVCLEGIESEEQAFDVAGRIRSAIARPIRLEGGDEVVLTASIGVAIGHEHGELAPADLQRRADLAMYRAKESGGDRLFLFRGDGRRSVVAQRLDLERQLREAFDRDQLRVVYQPVYSLTGVLVGAEALVRWEHPERGTLLPLEFIEMAEQTGTIGRLGRFVIRTVTGQLARWGGSRAAGLVVSVNLSPRQLNDPDLPELVAEELAPGAFPPERLAWEITESWIMETTGARAVLDRLRALGTRLTLDDFGTRYSSLTYLRELPFQHLKIDRSFVSGLAEIDTDRAIVEGVIHLAHGLGLTVTAEGVETARQLDVLRALEVDSVQGFHLGEPSTAAALERMLG